MGMKQRAGTISGFFASPRMAAMALFGVAAAHSGLIAPADAGGVMPLLDHRAVYDLSLAKSRREPAPESARGRIAYRFSGNACEGYTTVFRQVSAIASGDAAPTLTDVQSTSVEDGAARTLQFRTESREGTSAVSVVEGRAEKVPGGIRISLQRPSAKTARLDGDIVFPTEQVQRIIAAAKAGQTLLELNIYDGSDNGEKLYRSLSVIGAPIDPDTAPKADDAGNAAAALKGVTRWPVTVSYYDASAAAKAGEQIPTYAMSFQIFENGVSRALKLDYNDFVLAGAMSRFDAEPAKPCAKGP